MRFTRKVKQFHFGVFQHSGARNLVGYFWMKNGLVGLSERESSEGNALHEKGEAISLRRIPAQWR